MSSFPLTGTLIYLIRHGETGHNAGGRLQGHLDVELSERGRAQARAVAGQLAGHGIHAVYASDLARARETAEIIAKPLGLAVRLDPRLREVNVGECADLLAEEIAARFPELALAMSQDRENARYPGGESIGEMADRASLAVADIALAHPGASVALVAHGGPLRRIIHRTIGGALADRERFALDNCAVLRLELVEPMPRFWLPGPL